jgi:hypothetical protein
VASSIPACNDTNRVPKGHGVLIKYNQDFSELHGHGEICWASIFMFFYMKNSTKELKFH